MSLITKIKEPVLKELQEFKDAFAKALYSDNPLLSSVNQHVLQGGGKQIRPMLVLLAARIIDKVNDDTIRCAISLELLHNASLIHDDVVDDTFERRGNQSVNAQWNNKVAILVGDYLLSNALNYATETKNIAILKLISSIGMQLSDGELLQLANATQVDFTEEQYFNIIRKKTALLFSTCTEMGGLSATANAEMLESLRCYGEYLGICFQLKDDVFDYYEDANIGKPTGNDIRDGKVTLPLIYALKNASGEQKGQVFHWIKNKDFSNKNISNILRFAHEHGGIEYAKLQMDKFRNKAIEALRVFPDSEAKRSLLMCIDYVIDREN